LKDEARTWLFGGRVQGVGFRPFVYRVAHRYRLKGWVRNLSGRVEIMAQGRPDALQRFGAALLDEAPPLARPEKLADAPARRQEVQGFAIVESRADEAAHVGVPPDFFACDACLAELRDPRDRRHRYPFINCTQCGPRYTLIRRVPYDRPNTTMAGFAMCARCAAEYADPLNRRFHAEPVACPDCGPQLAFKSGFLEPLVGEDALAACVAALSAGKVVAVKGIGGYHLMCDAANSEAIATLRARKRRPHKPLAVMFPMDAAFTDTARALLLDPMRPIVLLPKPEAPAVAPEVAPGCAEIGAMLPYSPLHDLLLEDFGAPLVATSANLTGEPVLVDNAEAEARLAHVADAFLHHDRPIARPADDPVYRVVLGKPRPMRLGRGNAPLEIELPFSLPRPVLALGGHLKGTVALGWERRAVVSPHLGDMDALRSLALLKQVAADLQALYGVRAVSLVCDAHPDYATTRLAARWELPVKRVFHHHAHASALAGEFARQGGWLVFTWDGSGFGEDGTLWGGEALIGRPGSWRRAASLRPFALPGGERAAREPWRSALALCWETEMHWNGARGRDLGLLRHAWERGLNCPRTSSAGRLFDAAAALLGLVSNASFEAQAPMALEAACAGDVEAIPLPLERRDGLWVSDWEPLLERLLDGAAGPGERAALFHATLAGALLDQARTLRAEHGVSRIGLTGGVFQNRVLCERVARDAAREGFAVFIPERVPCNDAGLSFGQLVEAGARA
jgi:hydrogenase maturation protein HypF